MAKLFFAVNYDLPTILQTLTQDGWKIVPSKETLAERPLAYNLYQTQNSSTWATLLPSDPPYFSFANGSESDADLVDRFDCIGENDYHASLAAD